ncbi:uncharacterized protein LOC128552710 [Mercenaria mercenaria]|uniref:uncharacterized protein LOC128552710 n=1 Tax=Mercenaria mercenaria TaxID=6596 RepID=UPI00234F141A|nr:uncharacterized protein LOC128552710 [Mercenaria mercenaria]
MGMNDAVFKALTNCSWECVQCGVPNFSTGIFDTTLFESYNSFSNLTFASDSEISFSCPNATSSPQRRHSSTAENSKSKRTDMPLRILIVNCQSIKTPGKRGQLEHMIEATQADIVIGTESWLEDSVRSSEVFPPNFKPYRRDRQTGNQGGGVFILVSNTYESEEPSEISLQDDCEVVWCKVKIRGSQHLYIGSFYKPPSQTNPDYLDHLDRALGRIPRGAHTWLGGDFNLPDIDWLNECPKTSSTNTKQCQQLIDVTRDHFLEQIVTSPTRISNYSSNILDLFFTNNSTLVNKCDVLPGIGDHEAVFIESSLRPMKLKKPPRKVHIYKKADFTQIRQELADFFESYTSTTPSLDVNATWQLFEEKLKDLMDKHIPSKLVSGNKVSKPWINKLVKSNLRRVKKLYNRQKSTKKQGDREKYLKARSYTQKTERQQYW